MEATQGIQTLKYKIVQMKNTLSLRFMKLENSKAQGQEYVQMLLNLRSEHLSSRYSKYYFIFMKL